MAVTFVDSVIEHGVISSPNSLTPDFSGTSWQPGDFAIATTWAAVLAGGFWTAPAGWYSTGAIVVSLSGRQTTNWYKFLKAGEDETPQFSVSFPGPPNRAVSVVISIWRGVNPTNPLDDFSRLLLTDNDPTPTPPAVLTTTPDAVVVPWMGSFLGTSWDSSGAPSGYTLRATYAGATYPNRQQWLASRTVASPSTEAPGDWTHSATPGNNESNVQQTFALREPQTGEWPVVLGFQQSQAVNSTNHFFTLPALIGDKNLLLLVAGFNGTPTITNPSGWTRLDGADTGSSNVRGYVGYRIAVGNGEGGGQVNLVTNSNANGIAQIYRIDGYDEAEVPELVEIGGTTSDPPNLAPSWGAEKALFFATLVLESSGASLTSYCPGYNWLQNGSPSVTVPFPTVLAPSLYTSRRESVLASEDPMAFNTFGTIQSLASTIAIKGGPLIGGNPGGEPILAGGWGIPI